MSGYFEKKTSSIMKCRGFFCFLIVHQKISGNKTHPMTESAGALKNKPTKKPPQNPKKPHPDLHKISEPNKCTHEKSGSHEF